MSVVLLAIAASLSFVLLLALIIISVLMYGKIVSNETKINKIDADSERIKHSTQRVQSQLEVVLNELNSVNDGMEMNNMGIGSDILNNGQRRVFRSLDGKHQADTFEKLLELMSQDPDYKNMQQIIEDEIDEEDEDEDKPWEDKNK